MRGKGLMWGVDLHVPSATIIAEALNQGLLLTSAGEYTLRRLPPLALEELL